jgi:hypothetical protein
MATTDKTIEQELAEYEAKHDFARQVTLPWEDRMATTHEWKGGYRWFRSDNVVDLLKVRLLRSRRIL